MNNATVILFSAALYAAFVSPWWLGALSISDGPETLWMLERAKHKLMRICDDD